MMAAYVCGQAVRGLQEDGQILDVQMGSGSVAAFSPTNT